MSVHLTSVKSTETSATYHTQLTHHTNLHIVAWKSQNFSAARPRPPRYICPVPPFLNFHTCPCENTWFATVIFELMGITWFMLLCMKGGSCTCTPLTSTLTLHPPFEKSGYGPDLCSYVRVLISVLAQLWSTYTCPSYLPTQRGQIPGQVDWNPWILVKIPAPPVPTRKFKHARSNCTAPTYQKHACSQKGFSSLDMHASVSLCTSYMAPGPPPPPPRPPAPPPPFFWADSLHRLIRTQVFL